MEESTRKNARHSRSSACSPMIAAWLFTSSCSTAPFRKSQLSFGSGSCVFILMLKEATFHPPAILKNGRFFGLIQEPLGQQAMRQWWPMWSWFRHVWIWLCWIMFMMLSYLFLSYFMICYACMNVKCVGPFHVGSISMDLAVTRVTNVCSSSTPLSCELTANLFSNVWAGNRKLWPHKGSSSWKLASQPKGQFWISFK